MKLNFLCIQDQTSPTLTQMKSETNIPNNHYLLGKISNLGLPPIPAFLFSDIPTKSQIIYNIFSLDCCLKENGFYSEKIISEQTAFELSKNKKIYSDNISLTPYFRYYDKNGQHIVWIEDTYHQIKKINLLEKLGFENLTVNISSFSACTVVNLIHTDRYSI